MVAQEGDWKRVLEELKKEQAGAEPNCVRILGMIAERQAAFRDMVELNKKGEYHGPLMLPREVPPSEFVPELLERAKSLSDTKLDHYVIALARARDTRCKESFVSLINNPRSTGHEQPKFVRFHAAVGLANLHESAGVEWLIDHVTDSNDQVVNAWPANTCGSRLNSCCDRALIFLSQRFGMDNEQTLLNEPDQHRATPPCACVFSRGTDYWRKWWEKQHQLRPDARIPLVDWQQ